MESHPSVTDSPARVPLVVWILGLGAVVALVAIFVFNVALGTVVYYGFIALMVGSHFFMHGSHGGHGSHAGQQPGAASNPDEAKKNEHAGHSGGCH